MYINYVPKFKTQDILWLAGIFDLITLDFITKWLARNYLAQNPIDVWAGVFKLSLSYNKGVAFSIPIPNGVMTIMTPILLTALVIMIYKMCDFSKNITKLSLILLIAGGLGNFINRLWTGAVIDFIEFSFWPSFNFADTYLCIAAFLIILFYGRITVYGGRK